MTYQSLTLDLNSTLADFINQIDKKLPILGSGNPQGALVVALPGVFYLDVNTGIFYFCTNADGTTSTWVPTSLSIAIASESTQGILRLASTVEAAAQSNTTKAVTPAGLAAFAKAGVNNDITRITGLTTPLSKAQGGTGATDFTDVPSPAGQAGKTPVSDGTNYVMTALSNAFPVNIITTSGALIANNFHLITANNLTMTVPSAPVGSIIRLGFLPGVTGTVISGAKIMNDNSAMNIDTGIVPINLIWTGATYGWWFT